MLNEDEDIYDLRITFRLKMKKWRIDDQREPKNRKWALKFWDENLREWRDTSKYGLDRPGEKGYVESIYIIQE
jgi:hypothetical protein